MKLFAGDTVELIHNGIRRYVFACIDPHSRFAWASRSTQEQPRRHLRRRRAAYALRLPGKLTPIATCCPITARSPCKIAKLNANGAPALKLVDLSEVSQDECPLRTLQPYLGKSLPLLTTSSCCSPTSPFATENSLPGWCFTTDPSRRSRCNPLPLFTNNHPGYQMLWTYTAS